MSARSGIPFIIVACLAGRGLVARADTGWVACAIAPPGAVADGAAWRLAGWADTNWQAGASTQAVDAGSYSMEFLDIAGWQAPASRPVTVTAGATTNVDALYMAGRLSMRGTNGAVLASDEAPSTAKGTEYPTLTALRRSATNTFGICNTGDMALAISGVTTSGNGAASFSVVNWPASLAAGETGAFSVIFRPQVTGLLTGRMEIAHNGPGSPFLLRLKGYAEPDMMTIHLFTQRVDGIERNVFSRDSFTVLEVLQTLRDILAGTNLPSVINSFGGHPSYNPHFTEGDTGAFSNDLEYLLGPFMQSGEVFTHAIAVGEKSYVDEFGNYFTTTEPQQYEDLPSSATNTLIFYAGRMTAAAGVAEWLTNVEIVVRETCYRLRVEDDTFAPPAPDGLAASQGTYSNFVRVAWSNAPFADHYVLWRAPSATGAQTRIGGALTTNVHDDASAATGQVYCYWVMATNAAGASPASGPVQGWRTMDTNPAVWCAGIRRDGGSGLILQWNASYSNSGYTVEWTESLAAQDWTAWAPTDQWPIVAIVWTAAPPQAAAFFRIRAAPPSNAVIQTLFMDFDGLPVTAGLGKPGSAAPWLYTTATENPLAGTPMTDYDRAGWRNTNAYGPQTNTLSMFYLYYTTDNSVHMGFGTHGYLEIDDGNALSGRSLRYTVTGGVNANGTNGVLVTAKAHFTNSLNLGVDPIAGGVRIGHPYLYFANTSPKETPVPFPEAARANRFSAYFHAPASLTNLDDEARPLATVNIGPYNGIGGHWYHEFCTEGGGWTHALCDGHPQHNNAWAATNYPYPSKSLRDMGEAYFTNWYRWYVTFKPYTGIADAPYDAWFDQVEFLHDPEPQNNETICSPSITYFPASTNFQIGFMDKYKDNGKSYSTYELRYAFQPIGNAGWSNAVAARILTNAEFGIQARADGKFQKFNPYYQAVWAPFELAATGDTARLTAGTTVYFAIKDISQVGGDGMLPVTNSGIGPNAIGGRDYSAYSTNFDYAGDQPVLLLIKRTDFRIPAAATNGVLTLTFSPGSMRAAGARWRINGGAWNAKASQWVPEGVYTVEWADVSGWITPPPVTQLVQRGQGPVLTGVYQSP
ncbi:MAG TPA: choice-of-anchor D domain-containing protein [Kiritimatiellia bacterium]|nr:choice-of-anchor D domain-containing protein [Kiritimatiellia bacterium]HRZ13633.1 choice-of-anchor D domain-containing protein [Kiritimatiellia bacterium]HSA19271.1 choice-of-anchor D domain-containing protein [Kiritimatiellia bacterium]